MEEATIHTAAGDRWRACLRRPNGGLPERTRSLEAERDFWARRMEGTPPPPDPYAEAVYRHVEALARSRAVRSVLEIGPGWGNYTLPLCRDFRRVTCVDLSADNLRYLSARSAALGRELRTVCVPWEAAALDGPGGVGRHDMVFAYNCFYRLTEPERFLWKADRAARTLCVVGMNRPPELPWLPALERAGLPVHYTRQGCEALGEVLESLGIRAELADIPNERTYRYPSEAALLERTKSFLTVPVPREILLPLLAPFHRRQGDGSLICRHSFSSQLLIWRPGQSVANSIPGGV